MFFQRLAAKTDLVNTVVAQTYGLPDSLNSSASDMLVGVCEVCLYFSPTLAWDLCLELNMLSDERPFV